MSEENKSQKKIASRFWPWLLYQLKRFRWPVIAFLLLSSLVSIYFAVQLPLESDLTHLLPQSTASVRDYEKVKKILGGVGFYIVILESKTPDEKGLRKKADFFLNAIKQDPALSKDVVDIFYQVPLNFFRKYGLLYADLSDIIRIHQRLLKKVRFEARKANPYFLDIEDRNVNFYIGDITRKYRKKNLARNIFMDKENRRIAIFIKPSAPASNLEFNQQFSNNIHQLFSQFVLPEGWHYYIAGQYMTKPEQKRILSNDIAKTSGLTLLVLLIVVILFFRALRAAAAIGLPLFVGLSWTFALTYLLIGRISLISAFLSSILLGLGIDYGIHLLSRYRAERIAGHGLTQALVITFSSIVTSIGFGAFTTSVAFGALAFAKFQAFAEFGLIAVLGIVCCLTAFLITFPVFMFLTEKYERVLIPDAKVNQGRYRFLYFWIFLGISLNLIGISRLTSLKFDYNFSNLNAVSEKLELAQQKLNTIIDNPVHPIVYVVNDLKTLKQLDATMHSRKTKFAGASRSLLMFIPEEQQEKLYYIRQMNQLLRRAAFFTEKGSENYVQIQRGLYHTNVTDFSLEKIPSEVSNVFVKSIDDKKYYFYYLYPANIDKATKGIIDFAAENRSICVKKKNGKCQEGKLISGAADSIILNDILNIILEDITAGTLAVVAIILIILLLLIRSFSGFILVLAPLVSGLLSVVAFFSLGDILFDSVFFRLNYINVIIFPILIGVGIDNGLHLYRRAKDRQFEDIGFVMRETGSAVFLSNLTTAIGFFSLIFAAHPGLASLGLLAVIGIANIYVAYIVLFPFMIRVMQKLKWKL